MHVYMLATFINSDCKESYQQSTILLLATSTASPSLSCGHFVWALCTVFNSAVCSLQCSVFSVKCEVSFVQFAVCCVQCKNRCNNSFISQNKPQYKIKKIKIGKSPIAIPGLFQLCGIALYYNNSLSVTAQIHYFKTIVCKCS